MCKMTVCNYEISKILDSSNSKIVYKFLKL